MKSKSSFTNIFCILIGVYVATIIWITLLSRIDSCRHAFLFPFQSYIEVLRGNSQALIENLENMILFIPLGMILKVLGKNDLKMASIYGMLLSVCIELMQYLFFLGTFEFDDILNNTIGTVIGFLIFGVGRIKIEIKRRQLILSLFFFFVALMFPFICHEVHHQNMVQRAALHDRIDGTKNLLVLDGKNGYAWDTDVYIKTLTDGSIQIKGTSDKNSWWQIGKLSAEPGLYSFSGLSNVEKDTVALVIESNNRRLIEDVGPVDEVRFEITEETSLIVYVMVYRDCYCDVLATPVIYREVE